MGDSRKKVWPVDQGLSPFGSGLGYKCNTATSTPVHHTSHLNSILNLGTKSSTAIPSKGGRDKQTNHGSSAIDWMLAQLAATTYCVLKSPMDKWTIHLHSNRSTPPQSKRNKPSLAFLETPDSVVNLSISLFVFERASKLSSLLPWLTSWFHCPIPSSQLAK